MKSMTGFSKATISEHGITANVEIRSVNGRYLEISSKLPRNLQQKELDARDLVKSTLERGSVSLSIKVETTSTTSATISPDKAKTYFDALESVRKKLKIAEPVTLTHLMGIPDVFTQSIDDEASNEAQWKVVSKALKAALTSLDTMRKNEGREVGKDIRARVESIEKTLDTIEDMGMKRIPEEREKLRTRIAQLFDSDEIDEQRLQMEIVLIADKLDISEECVRLRSHIKFMYDSMKNAGESLGRQMNFMMQEMNREVNTIGSKCNDAAIARMVVAVKDELEKIREQVQNIE